ncbi:hypothetical protein [Streptomyces pinistramenti]|uniref:hypothetical protein n=1 Tax=Streptomyces pinistramenti TaxID=2884812 RepID=UPI001D0654E9|nr:hypothetical protein [Streptomyces pinistramenti]MCB5912309.1 hypothetical protein [Streptomyces pinistramenti]
MPVDPTDPDTFEDEETAQNGAEPGMEAPEADTAEQHADVTPRRDIASPDSDPDSANEADRVEQSRIVDLNEDEYR